MQLIICCDIQEQLLLVIILCNIYLFMFIHVYTTKEQSLKKLHDKGKRPMKIEAKGPRGLRERSSKITPNLAIFN